MPFPEWDDAKVRNGLSHRRVSSLPLFSQGGPPSFKPCVLFAWALAHPKSESGQLCPLSQTRQTHGTISSKDYHLLTYNEQYLSDASIGQEPSAIFTRKRPISPHKWSSALAQAAASSRFQQRGIGRAWRRAEGNWGVGAGFKAGQSPAPRAELEGICCMCQMS